MAGDSDEEGEDEEEEDDDDDDNDDISIATPVVVYGISFIIFFTRVILFFLFFLYTGILPYNLNECRMI